MPRPSKKSWLQRTAGHVTVHVISSMRLAQSGLIRCRAPYKVRTNALCTCVCYLTDRLNSCDCFAKVFKSFSLTFENACSLNCSLKPACWDRYDSTYMQDRYGCTRHTWVYSKVKVLLPLVCYSLTISQNAVINEQGKICWHNYERQIYLSYYTAS